MYFFSMLGDTEVQFDIRLVSSIHIFLPANVGQPEKEKKKQLMLKIELVVYTKSFGANTYVDLELVGTKLRKLNQNQ